MMFGALTDLQRFDKPSARVVFGALGMPMTWIFTRPTHRRPLPPFGSPVN